jgi:hypothetical protein
MDNKIGNELEDYYFCDVCDIAPGYPSDECGECDGRIYEGQTEQIESYNKLAKIQGMPLIKE